MHDGKKMCKGENMENQNNYEHELSIVKRYISLLPNEYKYVISAKSGVSIDIIDKLVEQGLLEEESGVLKEVRKTKSSVSREEERRRFANELRCAIKPVENNDAKSKLLIDLQQRRQSDSRSTGWSH